MLNALTVAVTIAACLLGAEVVLRFLPVASSLRTLSVTPQSPVFRVTPNRDFDELRYPDVAAAAAGTYFDRMRRAFVEKAASLGYATIDLDPYSSSTIAAPANASSSSEMPIGATSDTTSFSTR